MSASKTLQLLLGATALASSVAFCPVPPTAFHSKSSAVAPLAAHQSYDNSGFNNDYNNNQGNNDFNNNNNEDINSSNYSELQDLEMARNAFEKIFQQQEPAYNNQHNQNQQQQQPIMTTAARRRRQVEMDLVASLKDSDDATDQLVNLWMHETGDSGAAACMAKMQESCSEGLEQEEHDLLCMMDAYPTWAEPRVRLAFVFYYTDRFEDAYHMAMQALELKPWHFEAARLLVLLSHKHNDMGSALQEAHEHALPTIRPIVSDGDETSKGQKLVQRRRQEWVQRSLQNAENQWQQAEYVTQQQQQPSFVEESYSFGSGSAWE